MDLYEILRFISHIVLVLTLGFYLITNMQWYSYKIDRVILHHKKISWHIIFFVVPFFTYHFTGDFFWIYYIFALVPFLIAWYKKIDKKLIFTGRVKRFFAILLFATITQDILCLLSDNCAIYGLFFPLFFSSLASEMSERVLMRNFKRKAKEKITNLDKLKIVVITASYGKTSIKNFAKDILSHKFKVYATPRSINTLNGIIKDINENLNSSIDYYIVEAGARLKGDIAEIVEFLEPQYVILGEVGRQHIEYFKTLENIIETKLEVLGSKRLQKAFVYREVPTQESDKIIKFPINLTNIESNLDGLSFDLDDIKYSCSILGAFNTTNISSVIYLAKELGMSIEEIQKAISKLKPIEHRLQKIETKTKLIIDDSFNGNLNGMLEAVRLASLYSGRKVIITPGLVESDEESNIKLAQEIDKIFDLAILTGDLNAKILADNIHKTRKLLLKDKNLMQNFLQENTKDGDLVLFANDAPSYI